MRQGRVRTGLRLHRYRLQRRLLGPRRVRPEPAVRSARRRHGVRLREARHLGTPAAVRTLLIRSLLLDNSFFCKMFMS